MTGQLIRLRFLQLYRGSGSLGLFRVILVVFIFVPLVALFLVQRIKEHPWQFAVPAVALYILWMVHNTRKDYHFLTAIGLQPQKIYLAEYVVFTLPLTVLLLWAGLYIHALAFCAILFFITFAIPSKAQISKRPISIGIIPAGMFEWQGGIRKNLVVIIVFYIAGLAGFYQVWIPALSLLFLTLVFISFYSEYEPLNTLAASGYGSRQFIQTKLLRHTGSFTLLLLPLLLSALAYGEFHWEITGYFLASVNMVVFSILLKYYQYRPGAYSGAHQLLTMLVCLISIILPVALILIFCNLFLFFGADGNLKKYLND
ncbi:MAG: hypothetical protein ACOYNC_04275 [Bacteroidales bacterium]